MQKVKKVEISAPVGSFESLYAAIKAGADSIYFGIGKLNLRASSTYNFSLKDLYKIVKICKENNIKAYLTVNSIIYDTEIKKMRKLLEKAAEAQIDAIVATDIAVMKYANELKIPVHASTQLNISNLESVIFFSKYCDAVILARELDLKKIKYITKNIKKNNIKGPSGNLVKIEVFIHGAMCMAISGKCYLSLHEKNKSANRGECIQVCRRKYRIIDDERNIELLVDNDFILSPKDLCTIGFLDEIIKAGATILKIEGRARPPEYVYVVTKCYKEAVNAIFNKTFSKEKVLNWLNELKQVYNKGFWEGHYLGKKFIENSFTEGNLATRKKIFVGKVINYYKKAKVALVLIQAYSLKINDEIIITGKTTGVVLTKIHELRDYNGNIIFKACKEQMCTFKIEERVRPNDKVYLFK